MVDQKTDVVLMKEITVAVTRFLAETFPQSNLNTRINAFAQAAMGDIAFESTSDEQMRARFATFMGFLRAHADDFVSARRPAHQAMPADVVIINREGVSVGPLPEDLELIMCVAVSKMPVPGHPASEQRFCHDCNAAVWAGPETVKAANARPMARIVCADCMADRMRSGGGVQ